MRPKAPSPYPKRNPRDRMILAKRELNRYQDATHHMHISQAFLGMCCAELDRLIGKEGRLAFLTWAFDRTITTSKELTVPERFGLVVWMGPSKDPANPDAKWEFRQDLHLAIETWQIEIQGQTHFLDMAMSQAASDQDIREQDDANIDGPYGPAYTK